MGQVVSNDGLVYCNVTRTSSGYTSGNLTMNFNFTLGTFSSYVGYTGSFNYNAYVYIKDSGGTTRATQSKLNFKLPSSSGASTVWTGSISYTVSSNSRPSSTFYVQVYLKHQGTFTDYDIPNRQTERFSFGSPGWQLSTSQNSSKNGFSSTWAAIGTEGQLNISAFTAVYQLTNLNSTWVVRGSTINTGPNCATNLTYGAVAANNPTAAQFLWTANNKTITLRTGFTSMSMPTISAARDSTDPSTINVTWTAGGTTNKPQGLATRTGQILINGTVVATVNLEVAGSTAIANQSLTSNLTVIGQYTVSGLDQTYTQQSNTISLLPAFGFNIKVNGAYRQGNFAYIKVNGVYRQITEGFIKINGVYKRIV